MATCTLILAALLAADPAPLQPGDHSRSVEVDKRTRTYLVHVPPSYDGTKAVPVVLAFHGGGSNAQPMVRFCGLNDKADKEGFLALGTSTRNISANDVMWEFFLKHPMK